MAFVCVLNEKDQFGLTADDQEFSVVSQTTIGYDDVSNVTFTLFARLDGLNTGQWEASFFIVSYDPASEETEAFFRGAETRAFLKGSDRTLVLSHLHALFSHMLSLRRPDRCVMFSIDFDLPEKALSKYRVIARAFVDRGYRVQRETTKDGQAIWYFERSSP